MGSGNWFRSFICLKKYKPIRSKQTKVHSSNEKPNRVERIDEEAITVEAQSNPGTAVQQIAAARIQRAFRVYRARKTVRRLRDAGRFNILIQGHTVKKQTTSTLSSLHSWSNFQSQIKARRLCMVTEGKLKQNKMENQMKLDAKLHEPEVIIKAKRSPLAMPPMMLRRVLQSSFTLFASSASKLLLGMYS